MLATQLRFKRNTSIVSLASRLAFEIIKNETTITIILTTKASIFFK